MESKTENETNPLNTSEEIRKKAREELDRQLQGLLNDQPIQQFTDDNIENEVNRLMEEVDNYEKNYIPKEIDQNDFNELKKFEEEFMQEEIEEEEEKEDEKEESNELNHINEEKKEEKEPPKKVKKEKKTKLDLDLEIEDLENIIEKDYNDNKLNKKEKTGKTKNNIMQDKEIKELLNEYEKQLNIEVEREVEKEYKPKMDQNDIKRADILLKKDPLINEAIVQGIITREELILFIDYYEIFSITNKAKKVTLEHVKALDDLCLKNKKEENRQNLNEEKKDNKTTFDLNDEDAINKLTHEIEKKLENSEDILNKKLDYEKMMMNKNSNINGKNENFKNILDKYQKEKEKRENKIKSDKDNISNVTEKTGFTNISNKNDKI